MELYQNYLERNFNLRNELNFFKNFISIISESDELIHAQDLRSTVPEVMVFVAENVFFLLRKFMEQYNIELEHNPFTFVEMTVIWFKKDKSEAIVNAFNSLDLSAHRDDI